MLNNPASQKANHAVTRETKISDAILISDFGQN